MTDSTIADWVAKGETTSTCSAWRSGASMTVDGGGRR